MIGEEALVPPSDVVVDYTHPAAVKGHTLTALAAGRHVVIGTSGLTADDYREIDAAARGAGKGVVAAGNFSITAALLTRFAEEAARYLADVEVIDYASATKPDVPSGTARELAERVAAARAAGSSVPVPDIIGPKEARGAAIGANCGFGANGEISRGRGQTWPECPARGPNMSHSVLD